MKGNPGEGKENEKECMKEGRWKVDSSKRRRKGLHCDVNAVTGKGVGAE